MGSRAGALHRALWRASLFAVEAALFSLWVVTAAAAAPSGEKSKEKESPRAVVAKPEVKPAGEASDDKSGVALAGQVSEESAGPRGLIRFWITIENHTGATLDKVELKNLEIPGFALKRLCWPGTEDNRCQEIQTGSDDPAPAQPAQGHYDLADHLQPQQTLTIWGYLEANDSASKQNAFATVNWSSGGAPSSKTVTLGEVESLNWLRALALRVIHGWEWSFPVATLLGGFLYDMWRRWREKKEKSAESARRTKEREREELRDHQKRTWNLMLPRSQQAALKFYTPLAGAAQSARDQLRKYEGSKDAKDLPGACYELLFFHWRLRQAIDQIGGYYFKSRDAEQLADLIYQKHRFLLGLNDAANRSLLSGAVDNIKPTTTVGRFLQEKSDRHSKTHVFWEYFEKWATTSPGSGYLADDIFVLDAYAALLEYEANRPSLHWYGKLDPIRFSLPKSRDVISQWVPWKGPDRLNLSDELAQAYEKAAAAYLGEVEKPVDVTVKD